MIVAKVLGLGIAGLLALPSFAQIAPDNTTTTTIGQNTIGGGTVSGSNLYHSFSQFNVPPGGVELEASNLNGAEINNIFIRVTGAHPSYINGKIKTKKAFPNANVFLINSQGILFQSPAKLEVGGSFWGVTATSIGFPDQAKLTNQPTTIFPKGNVTNLEFASDRLAPILNQGELAVGPGRNLVLLGGGVFSDGVLQAPSGNVLVNVPTSGSRVEVRTTETSLGLTTIPAVVEPIKDGVKDYFDILRPVFPELPPNAQTLVAQADGKVTLVTENNGITDRVLADGRVSTTGAFTLLTGDVSLKTIEAANIQVESPSDIVLLVPQITATGNISLRADSTITFRDSLEFPANFRSDGNLLLRGDGRIDFLAVNHPGSKITVGGNLTFISRRDILGDGVFVVGGRVVVEAPPEQADGWLLNQDLPKLLQPSPRLIR
jgi:filamentous hemagglutinin family protein